MLYVANGMQEDGSFLDDLWALDLEGRSWTCIYGRFDRCKRKALANATKNEMAFGAQAGSSLFRIIYGGLGAQMIPCAGKPNRNEAAVIGKNDMRILNLATLTWQDVDLKGQTPPKLAFSSLVSVEEQSGFKEPLFLIGGGSVDCLTASPPTCSQPQPTNGIWIMDAAADDAGSSPSSNEMMASFDGLDDVLVLQLPGWCSRVTSMNIFAADFWMFYTATGGMKVILIDAYNKDLALMRWYAVNTGQDVIITLIVDPGKVCSAPHLAHTILCVCVCVCVCIYIYIYVFESRSLRLLKYSDRRLMDFQLFCKSILVVETLESHFATSRFFAS